MSAFLLEYGLFLLKTLTIVAGVGASALLIFGMSRRDHAKQGLKVEKLNDHYRDMGETLTRAMMSQAAWKEHAKAEKKKRKAEAKDKSGDEDRDRLYVLSFHGDIRATAVANMREEINAILAVARDGDEVVVCMENSGGAVQDHGLGASQLQRIRERGLKLTLIIDKVAASGGYMMACVADRIIAAPFAVVGSIGVLAQVPNFRRLLTDNGIEFEQVTAGEYKRTLTMFGENTDADREKVRQELEELHVLFKALISRYRPDLDIDKVATGETWYGQQAIDLGLIDELGCSDDYLQAKTASADVYSVEWHGKVTLTQRVQENLSQLRQAFF